jgi:phage terminase large subunit
LTYKPSGQVILFRGADDMDSVTSITVPTGNLCWLWIEEAYQINNEHDFNKLDLSFRGYLPDPLYKQVTLTFNPWNNLIWIKPRFFDKPDPDVFTDTTNYTCNRTPLKLNMIFEV